MQPADCLHRPVGENDRRRFLLAEEAYADLDEAQRQRLQALVWLCHLV
jgi:hypothetical protein